MHQSITQCRSCQSGALRPVVSLGNMPLADGLLSESDLFVPEPVYPLNVVFCEECALMQLRETVVPEVVFGQDYPYYSSFSASWMAHCRANALELIETRQLDQQSLVVEVASNDGYMLRNFHEQGIPVLGVDPVPGPATAAEKLGIPTRREFFSRGLSEELRGAGQQADVVIANNVLAHVADLGGFVDGLRAIIKPNGLIVVEVPYLRRPRGQ